MAQVVPFQPQQTAPPFRFQPTLDGAVYTLVAAWNVYALRWYISLYDQTRTRIFTLPLVASPPDYDLSLTAGYFSTPLVYREASRAFEVG